MLLETNLKKFNLPLGSEATTVSFSSTLLPSVDLSLAPKKIFKIINEIIIVKLKLLMISPSEN